jgi:hypothetical protein
MRVVNRQDFLRLPAGTIYCKGVQWAFDGLCIKGDSLGNDWVYLDMAGPDASDSGEATDILGKSLNDKTSFRSETSYGRDGCFDDDAVFLIFESEDLDRLRAFIDAAPRWTEEPHD